MARKYTWGAEAYKPERLAEKIEQLREEAREAHDGRDFYEKLRTGTRKSGSNGEERLYAIMVTIDK